MHGLKSILSHNTAGSKRLWMLIPALLLLVIGVHFVGVNILSGGKFYSSVYFWPILIAVLVATHILLTRSFKGYGGYAQETATEDDVVSRSGLHWHPEIALYVKGQKQEIPQVGLTNMDMSRLHAMHKRMQGQHMHEGPNEQGTIHPKFEGLVRKSDITLGQFFKKWGKSILTLGTDLKMKVNGKENTEYENYVMQDKDKIELRYE